MELNENTNLNDELIPIENPEGTSSPPSCEQTASEQTNSEQYAILTPLFVNRGSTKWLRKGSFYYVLSCDLYTNEITHKFPMIYQTVAEACIALHEIETKYKAKILHLSLHSRRKQTPIGEYDSAHI